MFCANLPLIFLSDGVSTKMQQNNAFTVAKRTLEGQDMVYQSIKFTNNVWALAELKIQPGNPNITVSNAFLIRFPHWVQISDIFGKGVVIRSQNQTKLKHLLIIFF